MKPPVFTLHANVNSHDGYISLRVTYDLYDDEGFPGEPITWRGKATALQFDNPAENALHLLSLLHRTVLEQHRGWKGPVELDQPLPGI